MATKEFWIQLESNRWDMNPHNINRMSGEVVPQDERVEEDLTSPVTGVTRRVWMTEPVDALILRNYTPNWAAPDDRRVNPWDLNEPDPTDTGTMGTIPGPTIACNVGDDVVVYFKNMDSRPLPVAERAHTLHPHGIVFPPEHDGAFPLSPPDSAQPVGGEAALWSAVGVTGSKQGDRVPPGGTFTYRWNTFGWPSTAGVWLYHDHAVCDHHNVLMGAIGVLVIHNPADDDDVPDQDLPGGQPNGRLARWCLLKFKDKFRLAPERLRRLPDLQLKELISDVSPPRSGGGGGVHIKAQQVFELDREIFQIDKGLVIARFRRCYVDPPKKALYLQLYHEMHGAMAINGRRWLGNTPTLIGGVDTKMRFGLVAMNNITFHTFHLHGHRWVIPGPSGGNVGGDVPPPGSGVQVSPLDTGASQFEDTRIFGPANSFSFTINQGSFMGPPRSGGALGEWHMHCHVLNHMMGGMMGSLLIVEGGQLATSLPRGVPCPTDAGGGEPPPDTVVVKNVAFNPTPLVVPNGTVVTFDFQEANHTVTTDSTTGAAVGIEINSGGGPGDVIPFPDPSPELRTATITGNPGDQINYFCGFHGLGMAGQIQII